jgi:hypothetical protein
MVNASWLLVQHDGAAAFKLSQKLHVPPALAAKVLPGGPTQIVNVRRINQVARHPAESLVDTSAESISDTEH